MQWYYQENGRQVGPITDGEFEKLLNSGKITDDTFVWCANMANWEKYGDIKLKSEQEQSKIQSVSASTESVKCSECGKVFSKDDLINFGDSYVCATCKPIFVQKLKEGTQELVQMQYAGFWIRFGAKFIDREKFFSSF